MDNNTTFRVAKFTNNKSIMFAGGGIYSIDPQNNAIVFTPTTIKEKIQRLIESPHNAEMRDAFIEELTNGLDAEAIFLFIENFPEYYDYFKTIALSGDNAPLLYSWMEEYHTHKESIYTDALIKSLEKGKDIHYHILALCDTICAGEKYNNALELEKNLKIMALKSYDPSYIFAYIKSVYDECYYNNLIDETLINHQEFHNSIVDNFYDILPRECELGVLL